MSSIRNERFERNSRADIRESCLEKRALKFLAHLGMAAVCGDKSSQNSLPATAEFGFYRNDESTKHFPA